MSGYKLAYCIDSSYSMPLAVSLRTLLEHWIGGRTLDVFVFENGLSAADKRKVENSLPQVSCYNLRWVSVDPAEVTGLPTGLHFSAANYFRLLLPRLLPDLDYVLYLDADTLISDDLGSLFAHYDEKFPLQACQDYCGTISNPLIRLPNYTEFGLAADSPYFNTGVLLMNLKKWREEKIAEKVIRLGREHPETLFFADQTPINVALAGKIGRLPPEWNTQIVHPRVLDGSWKMPFVPQDIAARKILHYTSEFKPWSLGRGLPQAGLFHAVLSRTAWAMKR